MRFRQRCWIYSWLILQRVRLHDDDCAGIYLYICRSPQFSIRSPHSSLLSVNLLVFATAASVSLWRSCRDKLVTAVRTVSPLSLCACVQHSSASKPIFSQWVCHDVFLSNPCGDMRRSRCVSEVGSVFCTRVWECVVADSVPWGESPKLSCQTVFLSVSSFCYSTWVSWLLSLLVSFSYIFAHVYHFSQPLLCIWMKLTLYPSDLLFPPLPPLLYSTCTVSDHTWSHRPLSGTLALGCFGIFLRLFGVKRLLMSDSRSMKVAYSDSPGYSPVIPLKPVKPWFASTLCLRLEMWCKVRLL